MPHMTSVSLGLWVGLGPDTSLRTSAASAISLSICCSKARKKRSARQISEAVEGVGGYLNAFTSEETTCFHARAGCERFPVLLEVLMDMLLNSQFAPADIVKEREVIKEEIAMYLDEPQHQVQELLNAILWPGQPLGRPITGTNRTLDRLRRPELLGYLHDNYVAARTVIVAAGNVRHRDVVRQVARHARRLGSSQGATFSPARDTQENPPCPAVHQANRADPDCLGNPHVLAPRRAAVRHSAA